MEIEHQWNHHQQLDWYVLDHRFHQGVHSLVRDLNTLYKMHSALYQYDFDQQGFEWINCHDATQSVLSYVRRSDTETLIVVLNFTPTAHHHYMLGVPFEGGYEVIMNSDSSYYAGSNSGNNGEIKARHQSADGRPWSINIDVPPLAGVILRHKNN